MSAADRARMINEVRARRERSERLGYAAGWTGLHFDALIEEIDELRRKEHADAPAP